MNDYEWDERKRQENVDKHDIDFTAIYNFEWDTAVYNSNDTHGGRALGSYRIYRQPLAPCRLYLAGRPEAHHQLAQDQPTRG